MSSPSPIERARRATDAASLLAACTDAGATGLLDDAAEDYTEWKYLPRKARESWDRVYADATLRFYLTDAESAERFRKAVGSQIATQVLFGVRAAVVLGIAAVERRQRDAAPPKPPPPVPQRPAPRPKPEPAREVPWPGMPGEELDAWAADNGVADTLARRADRVPGAGYVLGAYAWLSASRTVRDAVTATPSRTRHASAEAPPKELGTLVCDWLRGRAAARRHALETEREVAGPSRRPGDTRLHRAWEALREARAELRAGALPHYPPDARIELLDDPPRFRYHASPGETCGRAFGRVELVVPLAHEGVAAPPRCDCPGEERARCGLAVAAVDAAMASLEGRVPGMPAERIATALATPAWERTLGDLDRIAAVDPEEATPEIGWAVSCARDGLSVWPLRCTPKKTGGGYRLARATRGDVAAARGSTAGLDHLVADVLPTRGDPANPGRVTRAVERLAGHPRVFLDGKASEPAQVRAVSLALKVVATEEGGARLVPVLGDEVVEPEELVARAFADGEGRLVVATPGSITVVRLAEEVGAFVRSLARRGTRFPARALPELFSRLPALAERVPVLAGDLVAPLEPEPVWRVRLEGLPDDALRVELRVLPRRELPAQIPGEGAVELFVRASGGVACVRRSLAGEVAAAQARVAGVPLGPDLPDEPFTWLLTDPAQVFDVLAALQACEGVEVEWGGPPRRIAHARPEGLRVSVGSATDWLAIGGELRVDDLTLPMARLLEAIAARRPFVKVGADTWVRIEDHFRQRLESLADAADGASLAPVNAPALLSLQDLGATIEAPPRWTGQLARIREAAAREFPIPGALAAQLRPYQAAGFAWLARLAEWAEGAVLADDMGLGKTVQALALLVHRASLGPALVVAPTSVGFGWIEQAARFAPTLRVRLARGSERPRADDAPSPGDVWVTSYDLLVRDVEVLSSFSFATLVLDEAQAVKNPDTHRARAARALDAGFRVALSGTPLENRTGELWSLFAVVSPGVFGSRERFRTRYALPIEAHGDASRRAALARAIRPFVLRRLKREVAAELPPRTEVRVDVVLSEEERALYDAARVHALTEAGSVAGPEAQRRIRLLAALTRLRQLACHPRLVDPAAGASSTKLERVLELLRELRTEGRRVLVFSQFVRQLDLVQEALAGEAFAIRRLDGSTPAEARRAEVEAFQRGEGDVFLISLKAGGAGLNLTAASDVVLLDPWWNPAVEDQAADRAHRIGQARAVTIYRVVARETVEERILAMHAAKRDLVSAVLDGTGAAAALSVDELLALLRGDEPDAPPAPPPAPKALPPPPAPPRLDERVDAALTDAVARGVLGEASARTYRTGASWFVAWAATEPAGDLDALAARFRDAVERGAYDAPRSATRVLGPVIRLLKEAR
ncbi:MAG: SNF2-related protein [Myxococcota bacterium]